MIQNVRHVWFNSRHDQAVILNQILTKSSDFDTSHQVGYLSFLPQEGATGPAYLIPTVIFTKPKIGIHISGGLINS